MRARVLSHQALFDLLTAREHLYLYSRLKGVPEREIAASVEDLLQSMDLLTYADRISKEYSGGNKRKVLLWASVDHRSASRHVYSLHFDTRALNRTMCSSAPLLLLWLNHA
jgi:ABC-type Na+ transport system ATPase subunit NatA